MLKKILFLVLTNFLLFNTFSQEKYSRAKIWADQKGMQELSQLGLAVDHGTHKKNTFIISDFSESDLNRAKNAGFKVDILIEDVKAFYVERAYSSIKNLKNHGCPPTSGSTFNPTVPGNFSLGSMAGFYTYQEFLDILDDMVAQYPNLISQRAPVSDTLTHEGREIYFLKISNNPNVNQSKPRVMYTSIHHAREPGSLSETIFFMWYLLENYGTDPEVTYLVDNLEMYFIPMINPDGYIHNVVNDPNGGGMHRKNKNPNVGSTNPGVDLNRNYSYQWGTTGVSTDQNNDTYPGSGPFSEPETKNMKKVAENWNIKFAFNAHTYSGLLLYPIGATVQELAADHDYFDDYTTHMAQFNNYDPGKSSSLYPASGDSDDYMYKDEGVFAVTPEVGFDGFWPSVNQITPDCIDMLFPNLVMAHMPLVYGVTKETDLSSSLTSMNGNFNHSIQRLGLLAGQITVSIDPLTGIQSVGNAVNYNLQLEEIQTGAISYTLNPSIQYGDEIKYILETDNGSWVHRDTIVKSYGEANLQFADYASNLDNWSGDWALTSEDYFSADYSFTDSPNRNYYGNEFSVLEFNDTIDLTSATAAAVRYRAKWEIEKDWDYVQFQVSTDFGNSWISQCGKYTNPGVQTGGSSQPLGEPLYDGVQNDWILEEINFSDYLGQEVMVRFILVSDQYVHEDGYYFDDFEILYDLDDANLSENSIPDFKIIPNPASENVQISFGQILNSGDIYIVDATGKKVSENKVQHQSNKMNVDISNLEKGIYFVHIILEDNSRFTKRLVVLN